MAKKYGLVSTDDICMSCDMLGGGEYSYCQLPGGAKCPLSEWGPCDDCKAPCKRKKLHGGYDCEGYLDPRELSE